ncbi:hypothetical protein KI387_034438 [Taxus chinensis]|uniref:NPF family transporter n=1 Tax=Taxus chinensis TaxID=29808 RepID=A0AA38F6D6_TAXCH|nr:hypothetical protein KI387_034438 [Taxus chinensis]
MASNESLEFASDDSVDLSRRSVIRSKTGGWRACSSIIGYEFCERLAFAGIWSSLVVYLTTNLHEGTVSSSTNATNWVGTLYLTPLLGEFIADMHLGRFSTLIVFSLIYLLGMGVITLSVSMESLRPPDCLSNEPCQKGSSKQIGIFFFALYLLAVGSGGIRANTCMFGVDQFDDFDPKEKLQKKTFLNWWISVTFFGGLLGQTIIAYIQDKISWGLGYGIMTAAMVISSLLLVIRTPIYRHKVQTGSPLQRMANVFFRMIKNRKVQVPSDPSSLYEVDSKEYISQGRHVIAHTTDFRFLDKAAVQNGSRSNTCTVTDVEETKLVIRILRIWVTTIIPSTLLTQAGTLFVMQAMTLDRHIISPNFEFPAASIGAFVNISMLLSIIIYNWAFVPLLRRFTGNPRGITILQRMGIGMILHTIAMLAAMITDIKRRKVIMNYGLADNKHSIVPLNIFTLLPQFMIMGTAEAFLEVGKLELFYEEASDGMQSLGSTLYAASIGVGAFLNSVLLTLVSRLTGKLGQKSWILDNLNASHFDYYYAFLSLLSFVNYILYLIMVGRYTYKRETGEDFEEDSNNALEIERINIHDGEGIQRGI